MIVCISNVRIRVVCTYICMIQEFVFYFEAATSSLAEMSPGTTFHPVLTDHHAKSDQ